ncbi:NAD-dependent epimerase/dehydratase family protein [Cerasicoccus maritimus]|uniref:NAD-dependent epimerase/dehydratase family protein n=1 Tax=Cerasicoccus maritimus TaxID=490089 RepID=UPI00285290EF|nr:NAD(P)-dependent oxidoreductase [Cerasicoccus maritimus]
MKILITGGGGFLSRGMIIPIAAAGHSLRLMDVTAPDLPPHECIQGDVTNLDDVRRSLDGVDGIIINHMAPRTPDSYETPELCFKINVTGTANVLQSAVDLGVKRAVIISTTGFHPPENCQKWVETIPLDSAKGLYGTSKVCQEALGQQFSREHGMTISILRIGYIVNAEIMEDKYGRKIGERAPLDCDRRDVGEVARLALEREDTALDVFPVMSTREAHGIWGTRHTIDRLGWKPRYDFDRLPGPSKAAASA